MLEQEFQVGDLVEVLESQKYHEEGEDFFKVGDRGCISSHEHSTFCVVDFNDHGNKSITESGIWFVDYENIKLISRGEV